MKKIGIGVLVIGVVLATSFFINSNKKDLTLYETVQLSKNKIDWEIMRHMDSDQRLFAGFSEHFTVVG